MFKSRFKFSTDQLIQKAETEEYFEIEGLASTADRDLEGEVVKQNFDLSSILSGKGYLNDDHGQNYEVKDHARIGVIDEAQIRPEGLWIKGKVFKNHPASVSYYNELKHKPGMVQFSVEGFSVKRNPRDKSVVNKAYVTGVALTRNPVNPYTYAQLAKSLTAAAAETAQEELIKSQTVEVVRDEQEFVTGFKVIQELDINHPDFIEYYADLVEKGGMGSGRKPTGPMKPKDSIKHELKKPIEDKESKNAKDAKDGGDGTRDRESKEVQRREELKREKEIARESAKSPEEAKRNLQEVKERHAQSEKKKRVAVKKIEVKKSELVEELMRRASSNEEFKKSLEKLMEKALTTGGPAYATTLPGDMTGGQVMQTEELEADKKKKKKDDEK